VDWREAKLGGNVNPGWEPIVDELHAAVLEIDPDVVVDQVKEKFGGLRYYYSSDSDRSDEIEKLIDEAEAKASKSCEVCGAPGETGTFGSGWANTLCPTHGKVREEQGTPAWKQASA
jgi:hypothetical protein